MNIQEDIPLSHPPTLTDEHLQSLLATLERAVFEDDYRKEFGRLICFLLVTEVIERRRTETQESKVK